MGTGMGKVNLLKEIVASLPNENIPVREVRIGPYLTAVAVGEPGEAEPLACGLASTVAPYLPGMKKMVRSTGSLEKLTAGELAAYLESDFPLETTIGLAAVNALLKVPEHCYEADHAMDMIWEKGRGNTVGVVGHFPFVDKLREKVGRLYVLEQNTLPGDLPADKASEVLPDCNVVVVTATIFINGTFREILPLCRDAFTVVMGPSTPPSPILFEAGVDALAGSTVTDADEILKAVSQGASYRDLSGVKKWTYLR